MFQPDDAAGLDEQEDDEHQDGPYHPFPVPLPGGGQPLPFRDRFQVVPLRPAYRLGSLRPEQRILPGRAFFQQGQRHLQVPLQAIPVILAVIQLQHPLRMPDGQAVPELERPVFLSGQIQRIPPVTQVVVAQRETCLHRIFEAMAGSDRIPVRSIQLIKGIEVHADAVQRRIPGTDGHDILQQPVRFRPFPGIHIGRNQPERHLGPEQGVFPGLESLPSLAQIQRIFTDVIGPVIGIRHGAAHQAFQVPVPGDPRLFQRFLEGDDRLVIFPVVISIPPPMEPKPAFRGRIPFFREIGKGRGQQAGVEGIRA